jgi:hypothetical protein
LRWKKHFSGRPARAAHQAERTVEQMWQHPVGDAFVEVGEIELGDMRHRVEDALRMADGHAGDTVSRLLFFDLGCGLVFPQAHERTWRISPSSVQP